MRRLWTVILGQFDGSPAPTVTGNGRSLRVVVLVKKGSGGVVQDVSGPSLSEYSARPGSNCSRFDVEADTDEPRVPSLKPSENRIGSYRSKSVLSSPTYPNR